MDQRGGARHGRQSKIKFKGEKMKEEQIIKECLLIAKTHGGILRMEDVVEFARNPKTALHEKFNWDDTEAAHLYRLYQARNLIRVIVSITPADNEEHRVFVSLSTDQKEDGGGYRTLVSVMSDERQKEQLLADAKKDWEIFKSKYYILKELTKAFEEMDAALNIKRPIIYKKKKKSELVAQV